MKGERRTQHAANTTITLFGGGNDGSGEAAIVSAYRQGVPKQALSIGFRRSWETINKALLQAEA